jgi:hypothetical protein
MNSRRWLILIAMVGVLHNGLRAAAGILGASWGVFNYLSPFHPRALRAEVIAELTGLGGVIIFAGAVALSKWRNQQTSRMLSGLLSGALSGAALGLLATYVSTVADQSYGLALFIALPFLVGFVAVFVRGFERVTAYQAFTTSLLSVFVLGGLLMAFAIEGVLCLAMVLPIAVPLAICGGMLAYWVQRMPAVHHPATFLLLFGLTPFGGTLEHTFQPSAELFTVTTSLDIPAAPDRVWQTVLQPAKLAAPTHPLFRAGIAYPLASHIEGTGSTATRYCDFSTGKLVEPVLIWKEGTQLRFTVRSNPLPMQEWTPYAQIHPPHLEGFLASRQGEFRLERLPNGGTRLFATTWYQHHMWPATYWRAWSDYTIHRVHEMVLANIRERALVTSK